jgi:hypothetical protein
MVINVLSPCNINETVRVASKLDENTLFPHRTGLPSRVLLEGTSKMILGGVHKREKRKRREKTTQLIVPVTVLSASVPITQRITHAHLYENKSYIHYETFAGDPTNSWSSWISMLYSTFICVSVSPS